MLELDLVDYKEVQVSAMQAKYSKIKSVDGFYELVKHTYCKSLLIDTSRDFHSHESRTVSLYLDF